MFMPWFVTHASSYPVSISIPTVLIYQMASNNVGLALGAFIYFMALAASLISREWGLAGMLAQIFAFMLIMLNMGNVTISDIGIGPIVAGLSFIGILVNSFGKAS